MATRALTRGDELGYVGCIVVDRGRIYACGGTNHRPTLLASADGGATFHRLGTPSTPGLRALRVADGRLYVVGEYGYAGVSVDDGVTWTALPTKVTPCLFDLVRVADGTWWIAGDEGVLLRSVDGAAWQRVETGTATRYLRLVEIGGALHALGYDGTLARWTGAVWEARAVGAAALTAMVVTRAGTWIAVGEGGQIWRSVAGESFARVRGGRCDLEAIVELPRGGVLACGDRGTLLYSGDEGTTWGAACEELAGHLWSIHVLDETRVLIGGDDGALWTLDVAELRVAAIAEAEEEEVEVEEIEDEVEEIEDEVERRPEAHFASVEEASERWTREGRAFSDALNAYIRRIYDVGHAKAGDEPRDTRADMASYVVAQLEALGAAGVRARALFPPAYEPFDYAALGAPIAQAAYLRDGRRLVRAAHGVHLLERDRIVRVSDIEWFAQSFDRRWVAVARDGVVDITDGWEGPRARSLRLPEGAEVHAATVAPAGDAVLLTLATGCVWLSEAGARPLWPSVASTERRSYSHAALSPDGRFVAAGNQDSEHVVLDRRTGRMHGFSPVAEYPHFAAFHRDRPHLLLSSCHALYGSGSIGVDLDDLVAEIAEPSVVDRRAWVYAVASLPDGYVLGANNGYLWAIDITGAQRWFVFLGSTITALDLSPDGTHLLAGSHAGIVTELELDVPTDPNLLATGPVRDAGRWLFWKGRPPLIW